MTWRAAFMLQAKHEYALYRRLNDERAAIADQLHYLQMASEKLARGYLAKATDHDPPPMTHAGIIRMLQHLKTDPRIRRKLGFDHRESFRNYLDSLADTARRMQLLAPALAGASRPNPEYPWMDRDSGEICIPFQFGFAEIDEFKFPQVSRFLKLLNRLMAVVEP
jgi:hypothetical protein